MLRRDEIKRQIEEIDQQRTQLTEQLEQVEREKLYRDYLGKLVEADILRPAVDDVDSAFQHAVLRWLQPETPESRDLTIKAWVIATIGETPGELTPAQLRDLFKNHFGPKRVASLRQYLSKPFGLVQKKDGRLHLTKKGQAEFRKLSRS